MFIFDSRKIPSNPGIYMFKDKNSDIIYVGKAKNLKNRVSSYFIKNNDRLYKKQLILDNIFDIETISTNSEKEALILESNFIKKYRPKYNVLLKDNSEYCFLKINFSKKLFIPVISIVRRQTERDLLNAKKEPDVFYYGPHTSKKDLLGLLRVMAKIFPFQCLKIKELNNNFILGKGHVLTPCFNFHIKKCVGICCGAISREEYFEIVKNIMNFFSGKIEEVVIYIKQKMNNFSLEKKYEEAARYRDRLSVLDSIINKQDARDSKYNNIDVLSVYIYENLSCINLFSIKNGVLFGKKNFIIPINKYNSIFLKYNFQIEKQIESSYYDFLKKQITQQFIEQYYLNSTFISENREIVTNFNFSELDLKSEGIVLRQPKTKNEKNLLGMGERNAIDYINKKQINNVALEKIKEKLNLSKTPKRIECFDISNISGKYAVGSMSVFVNGLPDKNEYRRFKIRFVENEPNDPLMMREVLSRRFSKKNLNDWGVPDLIILDGGITQLGAILGLIKEMRVNKNLYKIISKIHIVSLAKREEEVILPHKDGSLKKVGAKQLFILRQIRDEAHRFGVTYFRKLYSKQFKK